MSLDEFSRSRTVERYVDLCMVEGIVAERVTVFVASANEGRYSRLVVYEVVRVLLEGNWERYELYYQMLHGVVRVPLGRTKFRNVGLSQRWIGRHAGGAVMAGQPRAWARDNFWL